MNQLHHKPLPRRFLPLLLVCAFVFLTASCGKEAPQTEAPQDTTSAQDALNEQAYHAYRELIESRFTSEVDFEKTDLYHDIWGYSVFDIDNDGMSELILQHPTGDDGYPAEYYTYDGENAVQLTVDSPYADGLPAGFDMTGGYDVLDGALYSCYPFDTPARVEKRDGVVTVTRAEEGTDPDRWYAEHPGVTHLRSYHGDDFSGLSRAFLSESPDPALTPPEDVGTDRAL